MKITAIEGIAAHAQADGKTELVDLSLTPDAAVGDWVLTFLGSSREILTEDEAQKIISALAGLRSLMEGGSLGDAFQDLEQAEPLLPPHLRAALDAGQTTG